MNELGTKTLKTERLTLRKFKIEDANGVFHNWAGSEKVSEYMTSKPFLSVEQTEQIIGRWGERYQNPAFYNWSITLNEINESIGFIAVVDNLPCGEVELGYCIGEKWWNKGIMTEALNRVIAFLFEEVGVKKVVASHAVENPASGRVMQKCKMQFVKTDEKGVVLGSGKVCDTAVYTIENK